MSNRILNLVAGEDLTGKEGVPAKVTAGKAYMCDAATDACIGVISRGAASGEEVDVVIDGEVGVVAAETVTRGEHVTLDAAGESCDGGLADGTVCLGIWLQDGVAGDTVPAFIRAPLRYEEG
jgi:hypothetical protein